MERVPGGGTAPLVVRTPKFLLLTGIGIVVNGLLNAHRTPWVLLLVPVGLAATAYYVRLRTVADDEGLAVRTLRGTRRMPWADVAAVADRGGAAVAVLRDGEVVPLPNVQWRPVVPSDPRYVYPRSGQAVAERARAAGHEVALGE